MEYCIGIDLGGTNIAAGVVDSNYKILGRGNKPTLSPRPAAVVADDMSAAALEAVRRAGLDFSKIAAVGIGSPGAIDPALGMIRYSNNLQFDHVPLCSLISKRLGGKPAFIQNDANAAALGELRAGAGQNVESFVAITLGTGIGSGIIINSKLYSGFNCSGGEFGHMVIEHKGKPCSCGMRGCFEVYASARGLISLTREYMEKYPGSAMWRLAGGSLDAVSTRTSFEGLRMEDEAARKTIADYIDYLGTGLVNIANALAPEILCIGGGIGSESAILIPPIRERLDRESFGRNCDRKTQIVAAELGNDAGIIGAAALCMEER